MYNSPNSIRLLISRSSTSSSSSSSSLLLLSTEQKEDQWFAIRRIIFQQKEDWWSATRRIIFFGQINIIYKQTNYRILKYQNFPEHIFYATKPAQHSQVTLFPPIRFVCSRKRDQKAMIVGSLVSALLISSLIVLEAFAFFSSVYQSWLDCFCDCPSVRNCNTKYLWLIQFA